MWQSIRAFVDSAARSLNPSGPVYHFGGDPADGFAGALALKQSFPDTSYIHCQLDPQDDGTRLPLPDHTARTVLWVGPLVGTWQTGDAGGELSRILAPGGVLLLAVPLGGSAGRLPDVWSPSQRTIERLLAGTEFTLVGWQGPETCPHTLYGIGIKTPIHDESLERASRFFDEFQQQLDRLASEVRWLRRLLARLARWLGVGNDCPGDGDWHRAQFMVHLEAEQASRARRLSELAPHDRTGTRLDTRE